MSRPLRLRAPGLWHHVTNRGLARCAIITDGGDAASFFELLGEAGMRWNIRCHAVCLMTNHYHLLLEDTDGLLSRAMRHIDGVFTQRFNRRHGRDGPLLKGRYTAQLVDRDAYLLEVVRYIHANPVEAGIASRAGDYAWSSHRLYLAQTAPAWLTREVVLGHFGRGPRRLEGFDRFVHERVPHDMRAALATENARPIIGSRTFIETWRRRLRRHDTLVREREIPQARRLAAPAPGHVVTAACDVLHCSRNALMASARGVRNRRRELALLACREFTSATNAAIGRLFGIAAASVPTSARRTREELGRCAAVRAEYQRLADALVGTRGALFDPAPSREPLPTCRKPRLDP